jgi:hypothetical protein
MEISNQERLQRAVVLLDELLADKELGCLTTGCLTSQLITIRAHVNVTLQDFKEQERREREWDLSHKEQSP